MEVLISDMYLAPKRVLRSVECPKLSPYNLNGENMKPLINLLTLQKHAEISGTIVNVLQTSVMFIQKWLQTARVCVDV